MKYLAVLAAVAITTNAVALPEAEAQHWKFRWCRSVGQPCWKVKRAAEAFTAAITAADIVVVDKRSREALASHSEGGEAYMAKRYLNDLAGAVASSQPDPLRYYDGLGLGQRFADDAAENLGKREAEAEAQPWDTHWCRTVGQPCWKAKRRIAEGGERVTEADWRAEDKRWCSQPGAPCSVAKRAAEALIEAVESPVDGLVVAKPEAEAEAQRWDTRWKETAKREALCTNPDEPCWKQETNSEAWKAQHDLDAMVVAARAVIENVA